MTPAGLIVLRVLGATAAAAVGAVVALFGKHPSHRLLCGLISYAAGALLSVAALHLLPEAGRLAGYPAALVSCGAGLGLFFAIGRYVHSLCPACSATETEQSFVEVGALMMVAMALHSMSDGLAIVAGYEASTGAGAHLGALILAAVSYHKVPEGLALMSVLRAGGYGRGRAFATTVGIEMATGLGAIAGLALRGLTPSGLGCLLGLVAGSFLYMVVFGMLKELWEHERRSIVLFAAAGAASLAALDLLLSSAGA